MPKYFAAAGSPFTDIDAEEIGPELEALAQSGASAPAEIVEYAKVNDTPLRRHLHMDRPVEDVADAWYRRRARLAASSIMVRVRTDDGYRSVRAFHSVTVAVTDKDGGGDVKRRYVTIQQVRECEPMSEQVLSDALDRLSRFHSRYETYRDVLVRAHPPLADVFHSIEDATCEV